MARESADDVLADANQQANELIEMAEREYSEARARSDAEAQRIIELAEQRALDLGEAAERERNEMLDQAQERYGALTHLENQLRGRIGTLEALVGEMRALMEPVAPTLNGKGTPLALEERSADEREAEKASPITVQGTDDLNGAKVEVAEDRSSHARAG
jgi:hypothetical protein